MNKAKQDNPSFQIVYSPEKKECDHTEIIWHVNIQVVRKAQSTNIQGFKGGYTNGQQVL